MTRSDALYRKLRWISFWGVMGGMGMGLCWKGYYISGFLAFVVFIYESLLQMDGVMKIFEGKETQLSLASREAVSSKTRRDG